jgi:hypothetical protein
LYPDERLQRVELGRWETVRLETARRLSRSRDKLEQTLAVDSTAMFNKYGIPAEILQKMRARDTQCVYCKKEFSREARADWPTIEHLHEEQPFYWPGLKEAGVAICCWSCNSSRGKQSLLEWFGKPYCLERTINSDTVAEPVRLYLRSRK